MASAGVTEHARPSVRRRVRRTNFARNLPPLTVDTAVSLGRADRGSPGAELAEARAVLALAEAKGLRVRASGAAWSFTPTMLDPDLTVDTRGLDRVLDELAAADLCPGHDPRRYVHVQAGARVAAVNAVVESRGWSLPCMAGRGGMTIAGLVATGSHGSAIDRPPPADFVRGLGLAIRSDRFVWLERASDPLMTGDWARAQGFELLRDDDVFDAAVVGFGCFGLVLSLVLELEPAFDLEHRWHRVPFDDRVRRWVASLDPVALPGEASAPRPYHVNLVVHPHRLERVWLSVAHQAPAASPPSAGGRPPPVPPVGLALAALARRAPASVPPVLELLIRANTRPAYARGRLGDIFPDRTPRAFRPFSMEVAVPLADAAAALDAVLREAARRVDGYCYPGFVAVRWVRGSRRLLAFTRFDRTCTIELPSMGGVPGTLALHERVRAALDRSGLGYVEHPAQDSAYDPPRLATSFGDALARWREARARFLGGDAWRFASPWSDRIGLTAG